MSLWSRRKEDVLKAIGAVSKRKAVGVYYVARNRGNNAVAPLRHVLLGYKAGKISWEEYEINYLEQLRSSDAAQEWMEDRFTADLDNGLNVLLVCFERSPEHCHRRLLAEEIKRIYPEIEYRGEVSVKAKPKTTAEAYMESTSDLGKLQRGTPSSVGPDGERYFG